MYPETTATMRPEEAIKEISSLQVKHNSEIQKLQENLKMMEEKLSTHTQETNQKIEKEFIVVNDKLTSHMAASHAEMNSRLNQIKEDMSELIDEKMQELQNETKAITEQNTLQWATLIKEMKALKHSIVEIKEVHANGERGQQIHRQQDVIPLSPQSQQNQEERNTSAIIINNDACSLHSNQSELSNSRIQTILLPSPTTAPTFHGKTTERPGQFLTRIEEYTETVHMWGEDMLLRGISQFLKDNALEWYCQLRSCNYLPRTWSEFKQTFVKQFNSPIRIAQQRQQWKECRQNRDETINEFIIRLRALWVEQYPDEKEPDLIKHLFCKMRPDILNVMGCPRGGTLQEILTEAQRVEEILYYRTKYAQQTNKSWNETPYNQNSHFTNRTKEHLQTHNNMRAERQGHQPQRNQPVRSNIPCYHCGRSSHRSSDCWFSQQHNAYYPQDPNSLPKNE